eukprot:gnl/MRDRNA2_/MRDRNA2_18134_c0_seq1.p1 gnl/MRDRNA2_/MRDRNA2_18134_c0~~gnl/MRDRNA2_/MRDRNA2_18134_c0_seq1.p1  ORF type:complete len:304 (+),score=49.50 gnl/MRDRNA2_/MRDRNA2_18134_c0_seq1:461-1372(+)
MLHLTEKAASLALEFTSHELHAASFLIMALHSGMFADSFTLQDLSESLSYLFKLKASAINDERMKTLEHELGVLEQNEGCRRVASEKEVQMTSKMMPVHKLCEKLYWQLSEVLPQVYLTRHSNTPHKTNQDLVDYVWTLCCKNKAKVQVGGPSKSNGFFTGYKALPHFLTLVDECVLGFKVAPLRGCPFTSSFLRQKQDELRATAEQAWLSWARTFEADCESADEELVEQARERMHLHLFAPIIMPEKYGNPRSWGRGSRTGDRLPTYSAFDDDYQKDTNINFDDFAAPGLWIPRWCCSESDV